MCLCASLSLLVHQQLANIRIVFVLLLIGSHVFKMIMIGITDENCENKENENMESDNDNSEEDNSEDETHSSNTDDEESSDLSAGEYEKYCIEHSSDLTDLEYQYLKLRKAFKNERLSHLNSQLCLLADEQSPDFIQPVEELTESKNERIHIAGVMRDLRTANAKSNYEADLSIIEQDYQNEKRLLKDQIKQDIEEKIKKLNEDRYKADNDFMPEHNFNKRSRKQSSSYHDEFSEKRRKPMTVNGPFIVYALKDEEIMEDFSYISCLSRPYKNYSLFGY